MNGFMLRRPSRRVALVLSVTALCIVGLSFGAWALQNTEAVKQAYTPKNTASSSAKKSASAENKRSTPSVSKPEATSPKTDVSAKSASTAATHKTTGSTASAAGGASSGGGSLSGGSSGGSSFSCNLYAATTGSDTASGAQAAPFKTASKLMSTLNPGQTGCLMGGTYTGPFTFSKSGSSDTARITLTTAPGYAASTLTGSYVYTTGDYITLQNLKIVGTASVVTMQTFGNNVTYRNLDITNNHAGESCITVGEYSGTYAKIISGFVLDHSKIHDCGELANGAHDHGLYLAASRNATVSHNWFWGNEGGWAIQLWADAHGSYIANNILDGNYNGNLIIGGGNYSAQGPSSNNTLEKNIYTNPLNRYQVESYWQGSAGTNNVVRNSCIFGSTAFGTIDTYDGGFTSSGIITADPLYVNRAAHNYTLASGSPCASYGTSGTVGVSS